MSDSIPAVAPAATDLSTLREVPSAWPKTKCVGRIGDMAPAERTHMRVILDGDNDVIVDVWQHDEGQEFGHSASIEFCNGAGGGGGSPRTRTALLALMVAMEADNADRSTARKAFPPTRARDRYPKGGDTVPGGSVPNGIEPGRDSDAPKES